MPILESIGDCEEVRELTAAFTSKVRGFRSFYGPNYGGLALTDMQSWEHSEVMQEIFKAFEQENTAVIRAPTAALDSKPEEDLGMPPSMPPGLDWWFMNQEVPVPPAELMSPAHMDAFGVRLAGASSSSAVEQEVDGANNAFLFPPLPIVSPNYASSNFKM
jgi:hypothetical protein